MCVGGDGRGQIPESKMAETRVDLCFKKFSSYSSLLFFAKNISL